MCLGDSRSDVVFVPDGCLARFRSQGSAWLSRRVIWGLSHGGNEPPWTLRPQPGLWNHFVSGDLSSSVNNSFAQSTFRIPFIGSNTATTTSWGNLSQSTTCLCFCCHSLNLGKEKTTVHLLSLLKKEAERELLLFAQANGDTSPNSPFVSQIWSCFLLAVRAGNW